jgi:hypothetical protein
LEIHQVTEPIKLYLDEDTINRALINALRSRNVDVLTAQEAEQMGRSDQDQLAYATALNRTIFTFNTRDFVQLPVEYLGTGPAATPGLSSLIKCTSASSSAGCSNCSMRALPPRCTIGWNTSAIGDSVTTFTKSYWRRRVNVNKQGQLALVGASQL